MRTLNHLKTSLALAAVMAAAPALAQNFPTRSIKLVVPFGAGGSTDAIARMVGQKLGETLGQSVVIDNRPGAAGAIASEQVAKAPADGYTLLMATTSTHAILPVANPRLPYDAVKDFAPVGLVARAPNVLVVSNALGVSDVKGLVELAKSKPGQLSFASSGNGTITHLVGEQFKANAGVHAVHIPYKTGFQALADMVGGQIGFQFDSITWTLPQARAGKIKALAVTGLARSALAPELPTLAESGMPGFEGVTWFGFMAPAGTPPQALATLEAGLAKILQTPDVQQKMAAQGAEVASGKAQDLAKLMRDDSVKWAKVVKDAGVKFE
jgi:tripartite-type tricarboxylate transporter receptor subunit TctC